MIDMNVPMDETTETALSQISNEIISATVVFKDDKSEADVSIAVGLSEHEVNDEDVFYYAHNVDSLRSLLKGAKDWECNASDFYIISFGNGKVSWEAK